MASVCWQLGVCLLQWDLGALSPGSGRLMVGAPVPAPGLSSRPHLFLCSSSPMSSFSPAPTSWVCAPTTRLRSRRDRPSRRPGSASRRGSTRSGRTSSRWVRPSCPTQLPSCRLPASDAQGSCPAPPGRGPRPWGMFPLEGAQRSWLCGNALKKLWRMSSGLKLWAESASSASLWFALKLSTQALGRSLLTLSVRIPWEGILGPTSHRGHREHFSCSRGTGTLETTCLSAPRKSCNWAGLLSS